MAFVIGETYETRGGGTARFLGTYRPPVQSRETHVFAMAESDDAPERIVTTDCEGRFLSKGNHRLDVLPPKLVGYLNIYPRSLVCFHPSRQDADRRPGSTLIASVRVEYREGQFDE